jgi:hypothetical protein
MSKWSEVNLRPTVSRPVSLGVGLQDFFSVWQLWVSWCEAPSLTRGWVCNLLVQLLLGLARVVTLRSKSRRAQDHILRSHVRLPQPGRPGPRNYIPHEQGGPVISRALGSLFVASYNSQGYGGGILTHLHSADNVQNCDIILIYIVMNLHILVPLLLLSRRSRVSLSLQTSCENLPHV